MWGLGEDTVGRWKTELPQGFVYFVSCPAVTGISQPTRTVDQHENQESKPPGRKSRPASATTAGAPLPMGYK